MQKEAIPRSVTKRFDFDCSICFSEVEEPVVTLCGHLFCWDCLYRWGNRSNICPVCKTICTLSSVIPIYSKGVTCAYKTPLSPKKYIQKRRIPNNYQENMRIFHIETPEYRRDIISKYCLFTKILYAILLAFCVIILLIIE